MTDGIVNMFHSEEEKFNYYHQLEAERLTTCLTRMVQYAFSEKWEEFCSIVELVPELMPFAFDDSYYSKLPKEYRRDFAINCYMSHGDHVPGCRRAVRDLPRNGINELPQEYRNLPHITVYRAGEEDISKAKYRLSWTLSLDTAEFFLDKYCAGLHAQALYKAKIKPQDVIAYTNDREEHEVFQYRKVYDIELVRRRSDA